MHIGVVSCSTHPLISLPNDKNLDWSKLKVFADDTIKMTNITVSFGKVGKHCGKRRKCWLPAFSPFPTIFSKRLFVGVVENRDCVVKS